MLVRPWDRDKDYSTLVKWWTQWEFGTVPKECLPPLGIVVSEDFVYPPNLGISYQPPSAVTNRAYEWRLNDLKREIQVIQPKYMPDLIRDYERYAKSLPDVKSEVSISDVKY